MNLHISRTACYTDTAEPSGATWAWDRGASCGGLRSPDHLARHLAHTPSCRGCARLRRAVDLMARLVQPYPSEPRRPRS